jgi:hypothetical protein
MTSWVPPILGVVVGYFLSLLTNTTAWLYARKNERRRVRALVALEIDHNLSALHDYWHDVVIPVRDKDPRENWVQQTAARVVSIPLPRFSYKACDSQLSKFPEVFSKQEMRAVWQIYNEFAQIEPVHTKLAQIINNPATTPDGFTRASRGDRAAGIRWGTYTTEEASLMGDVRTIIPSLLRNGNMLKEARFSRHHWAECECMSDERHPSHSKNPL